MTVVVRVQRHLFTESLNVTEQLELPIIGLPLSPQFSSSLLAGLGNLVHLKNSWILVENAA